MANTLRLPPPSGAVAGIDVGYSKTRETTGLCVLSWTPTAISWACRNASTSEASRIARLAEILPADRDVLAVGIDGPLVPGLRLTTKYRACEALLSRGPLQRRGKPGPTHAGSGPALHREATVLARFAVDRLRLGPATHEERLHDLAVFETFPNLFLGTLLDESSYPVRPQRRRKWTDTLYPLARARLAALLTSLLPARALQGAWPSSDHEEIASFACAVSALCLVARRFTAVGAANDGFIVLPPREHLGAGWPQTLAANLEACRADFPAAEIRGLDVTFVTGSHGAKVDGSSRRTHRGTTR